jgi:hypothetical protein
MPDPKDFFSDRIYVVTLVMLFLGALLALAYEPADAPARTITEVSTND